MNVVRKHKHTMSFEQLENDADPIQLLSSTADTDNTRFRLHCKLIDWSLGHGGYIHPNVEIAYSPHKGYHARVADGKSIESGTRVLSCPISTTLSVLNVLGVAQFSSHGTNFPSCFIEKFGQAPDLLQTFFLMEQYLLGDQSFWHPYIQTLPSPIELQVLEFEKPEDVLWIEGTNLKSSVFAQSNHWRDVFDIGMSELHRSEWKHAVDHKYTWELFRWAARIFGSRSFTSRVLADTTVADQVRFPDAAQNQHKDLKLLFERQFAVLLPLVDIPNHQHRTRIEWEARYGFVALQVLQTYGAGVELCNNYGPRDNESLLLSYGFVFPRNAFDHVNISIGIHPQSPLAAARQWKQDLRCDDTHQCYIFGVGHPRAETATALETCLFSFDLLESVSVLSSNDRELQQMFTTQQTLLSTDLSETGEFENRRNLLASVSQLMRECKARADRLHMTNPETLTPPQSPTQAKQIYVKEYRRSQLDILETAFGVCRFILARACEHDDGQPNTVSLNETGNGHTSHETRNIKDYRLLTYRNELFSHDQLLEMVPEPLSTQLQGVLTVIQNELFSMRSIEGAILSQVDLAKSKFAIILSVIQTERLKYLSKAPRLQLWIDQLRQWYPPDDENWSYVPPEGPAASEGGSPPGLVSLLAIAKHIITENQGKRIKRWLRPESLCWGWNVCEEEGIVLDAAIVQQGIQGHEDGHSDEMTYVVFCERIGN